jgi:hypothetical protein
MMIPDRLRVLKSVVQIMFNKYETYEARLSAVQCLHTEGCLDAGKSTPMTDRQIATCDAVKVVMSIVSNSTVDPDTRIRAVQLQNTIGWRERAVGELPDRQVAIQAMLDILEGDPVASDTKIRAAETLFLMVER